MKTGFHDLGIGPPKAMSESPKERKHYPSTRVPLAAIKGAPQDGSEFTATVKVCVRSVDNRDDAADIEIKGIALDSKATKSSEDSDEPKSRVPRRSLKESMEMTAKATPVRDEDY